MVESLDSPRPQPTPIQPLLTGQSQSGGQYVAVLNDENKVINISAINSLDIDLFSNGEGAINNSGNVEFHCIMICNCSESLAQNDAIIGYYLNEDLCAFIPPQPDPTYILDEDNLKWIPNKELLYDFYKNGILYRYDSENEIWVKAN
jgi:hypothetical protein